MAKRTRAQMLPTEPQAKRNRGYVIGAVEKIPFDKYLNEKSLCLRSVLNNSDFHITTRKNLSFISLVIFDSTIIKYDTESQFSDSKIIGFENYSQLSQSSKIQESAGEKNRTSVFGYFISISRLSDGYSIRSGRPTRVTPCEHEKPRHWSVHKQFCGQTETRYLSGEPGSSGQ